MICEESVNMSILGPVLGFPNRVPVAIETDWLSRAQLFGPHAFRTNGIDNKTVPLQAFFGQPEASPLGLAWPDSPYATVVGNEYPIGELHSAEYPGKQQTGRLD
ncbi:hypothetical protein KL919_004562 [Ogataea angusta]|nr:hypothetical protein KL919_004562 [Ogataea angusta]